MTMLWPAPAKINLFLHVVGRRADGYHLLQTVFQFLDFTDQLSFELNPDGAVSRRDAVSGVGEAEDLSVRAARLLQQETGCRQGVTIGIDKNLPVGGGLGGGSSDAATTLLALNRLWDLGLPLDELARLGLKLGADVPVFIHGQAAWAEGIGERLTPVDLAEPWYLVLIPPVAVSTARVFARFDGDRELTGWEPAITIRAFHEGRTRNDLEPAARALYPEVGAALDWLRGFGPACLSGSGGSVFLAVDSEPAGRAILARYTGSGRGLVARGLNRHPLHRALLT